MSLHPLLDQALAEGIFWITKRIALGQFVSAKRCKRLIEYGVTHVLNVAEAESLPSTTAAFQRVVHITMADLTPIPAEAALLSVRTIHEVMAQPGTKLYIHCSAGQNRSPTVLWLYLLACGMDADSAKRLIIERSPDAVPGHAALVDEELIDTIKALGKSAGMDLTDRTVLEPAYSPTSNLDNRVDLKLLQYIRREEVRLWPKDERACGLTPSSLMVRLDEQSKEALVGAAACGGSA